MIKFSMIIELAKPSITVEPGNIVCSEEVTLTVSIAEENGVTYQWIKDRKPIKSSGVIGFVKDCSGINDQTLRITNFSLQEPGGHHGEYVCGVTINGQSIDSETVQLKGLFTIVLCKAKNCTSVYNVSIM